MSISASTKPVVLPKRNVLVILSWGSFARYRPTRPMVTVGELRRQLAKEVGRIFDGVVVGLEFLITGTDIVPDLLTPLSELTHPPYRNVCLDVVGAPPSSPTASADSVGERLLRRHLSGERFQAGIDQRLWRLIELRWPHAVLGISTMAPGPDGEVAVRLNLERYPTAPPQIEFWNADARAAIEPPQWSEDFIRLAGTLYPEFASIHADSYCLNLLLISIEAASRLKCPSRQAWDVSGDLTQLLSRASSCFRLLRTVKHHRS